MKKIKGFFCIEMITVTLFFILIMICFIQVNNKEFWGYEKITEYTLIEVNKDITEKKVISKNDSFKESQDQLNKINRTGDNLYIIYATNLKTGEKRILFKK